LEVLLFINFLGDEFHPLTVQSGILRAFVSFRLWLYIAYSNKRCSEPGSVVSITTGYGLDGPGIESRWGARFSAPVQTGPGAHPASCTMGTGSFPGVKSGRGVTLTPHSLLVPRSRKMCRAIPLFSVRVFVAYDRVKPTYKRCTVLHFKSASLHSFAVGYKDKAALFCLPLLPANV
jgi:hypothetical protein